MRAVFADTSAWFALADRSSREHAAASAFLASDPCRLVTSNLVFAETLSLMMKRIGKAAALSFGAKLRGSSRLRIIHADPATEERAWQYFESYRDKDWDLIDCVSFALMDRLGLDTAFTFDRHFSQKGFTTVP